MKTARIIGLGAASLLFLLLIGCSTGHLRRSEEHIRDWLLREMPKGSSVAQVKAFIAREGWELNYDWSGTNPHASTEYPYVKGTHVVGAYLGHYQGMPWRVDVDAFLGFDDEGRLIDVHVRKCADAL